ncbi:alpha/beta hydrolase family protein [Marinoscillum sp.]|uniref:alpha/beta hydrolase family protein n=1 Tax=Marinoscillum sp. TaxID=2024838 RepID=UPI003BAB793B
MSKHLMKIQFIPLLFTFLPISVWCQEFPFWGNLEQGSYGVGYSDTIIYNEQQKYSYLDYEGPKPYLVSFWFPLEVETNSAEIEYAEYLAFEATQLGIALRDSLIQMRKQSFIDYGIKNRLDSWEDRPYGQNEQQLFQKIILTKVNAKKVLEHPLKEYPVIIYHHGMGGSKEENSVLFEYLASHGFVIVSSNYHWPKQSTNLEDLINDLMFATDFAARLSFTDSERMYFLGHSWGAQIGLILNQSGRHSFKSFILLDNTLEKLM